MTEFETAQLVFMQAERQANLLNLIQTQADLLANDATQFSSLLFGYLLAAYFIGANLTKVQIVILNVLYVTVIGATMFQMTTSAIAAIGFRQKFYEVSGFTETLSPLNEQYMAFGVLLNIALVLASLYFMWSIRHTKTK